MLRIIQFDNGRYGLQNTFTGIVLPVSRRTLWGIKRYQKRKMYKLNSIIKRFK